MTQNVINEGIEIFNSLQEELHKATGEIIVVSAWFTDQKLLDSLVQKAKEGLPVKVALSVNKDNERLDFTELSKSGGSVYWVEKKGYGMLHDKYCVIDGKIAFHGSYNWTNNAKNNNKESVIKTDHKETVEQLSEQFQELTSEIKPNFKKKKILDKILDFQKNKESDKIEITEPKEAVKTHKTTQYDSIDEIFESIISAEIKKTNREELKERAYTQAKEVSGDSQIITKSMDSLYHIFISDKSENESNKEHLISKIDKKSEELIQDIHTDRDEQMVSKEIYFNTEEKGLNLQRINLEGKKEIKQNELTQIENHKIPEIEKKIEINKNKDKIKLKK